MARATMQHAVLLLCLAFGLRHAAAATQQAMTNDIIDASTPIAPSQPSDGSDIMIYSAEGKLRSSLHLNFTVGSGQGSLGISGSAEYVFFASDDSKGKLAVVRVAGGKPEYMGSFFGGKDLKLNGPSAIASGDVSASGDAFVYVSGGVSSKACKTSAFRSIATQIVELRFTPGSGGRKSSLRRGKTFDAYRSSKCSEKDNVVLGMRTIGNNLYVVLEENPGKYTMRSYSAFSSKPKRSQPILQYSASVLSAVTIDSPTSFVAQGLKPKANVGFFSVQYQIRIEKGKKPLFGTIAPGKANSNSQRLYYGGLSSYTDGKGIVAATGALNDRGYGPVGNSIYKFNAKTLVNPRKLFTLKAATMCEDLVVVQKPRKLLV